MVAPELLWPPNNVPMCRLPPPHWTLSHDAFAYLVHLHQRVSGLSAVPKAVLEPKLLPKAEHFALRKWQGSKDVVANFASLRSGSAFQTLLEVGSCSGGRMQFGQVILTVGGDNSDYVLLYERNSSVLLYERNSSGTNISELWRF